MTKTEHPAYFEQQHERLDAQLPAHLLEVVGGDFAGALQRLQQWRRDLDRHTEIENARLLPHAPEGARWAARVYLLEHERIARWPTSTSSACRPSSITRRRMNRRERRAVLVLLDAAHALRHVLEHHNEREHIALAQELPLELQKAAWADEPASQVRTPGS